MKTLDEIGATTGSGWDKGSDRHAYTKHYDELFTLFRDAPIRFLEIGVEFGLSTKVWLEYFSKAEIYGVDIRHQHNIIDPRFHFTVGDQRSVEFWREFVEDNGCFDVVLDDGCHHTSGIMPTFFSLWPHVVSGGYYICEDLMCSYLPSCDEPGWPLQIQFFKRMVDEINMQTHYRNTEELRRFPVGLHGSLGIEWVRFSEELCIIKKK